MYGELAKYVQTIVGIFSGSKSCFELGLRKAISGEHFSSDPKKSREPGLKHQQQSFKWMMFMEVFIIPNGEIPELQNTTLGSLGSKKMSHQKKRLASK